MLNAKNLSSCSGVRHLFFSRRGGVSKGVYASLNCGPGSADDEESVLDNRARAMAAMDLEPETLVTLYQVHSPTVIAVEAPWTDEPPKADGMVTREPGLALGILTADCAPVLFADADAGVVGAAHAGWKGALGGVIDETISAMVELGAVADRISSAVGPCIMQKSYEVGAEFRSSFLEAGQGNGRFFELGKAADKYHFDLPGYVVHRLNEAGVGSIEMLGLDTYQDADRFFSYRRMTHADEPDYGRMLSAICLEET